MLSILIPVYRFDVRPLVQNLLQQARQLTVEWEICCLDDGSPEAIRILNREIASWPGVRYRELPENVGRSRIRNLLADEARFPYLLFMDCDGLPAQPSFLASYLECARPDLVVAGTRAYPEQAPADPLRFFHWYYGHQREQRPAADRNRQPYDAFCTFHFLCPADIFRSIRLDESLRQYGHEDTQFGADLREKGIPVLHIDNAYVHQDIETTEIFLEKTRQGIENLALLGLKNPNLGSRLLKLFRKISSLSPLLALLFRIARRPMERQFHSSRPSLLLFDLYKLGWLSVCMNQHPTN